MKSKKKKRKKEKIIELNSPGDNNFHLYLQIFDFAENLKENKEEMQNPY
jgi:hypothetical protein